MKQRRLGRGVALVGAGMSGFGAFPELTSRDLFVQAYLDMLGSADRGISPADIEAVYIGNYSSDLFEGQGHTAPIMTDWVGLSPLPSTRIENACASGGAALRQAILAVASGLYDVVLVGGIEKMTTLPTERVTDGHGGRCAVRNSGRLHVSGILCRDGYRVYGTVRGNG